MPQFDVYDGILRSTTNVYWPFGIQMTTFRLLPEHHQAVLVTKSHLLKGLSCLFFKPGCQGMTADAKDTLYASHARTFIIGSKYLFLLFFGVSSTWLENTAFAAILTPELLTATCIVTILDDV